MGTLKLRPQSALTKERAFEILFDLGQADYRSFEASKQIRSQKFTDPEVPPPPPLLHSPASSGPAQPLPPYPATATHSPAN